MPPTVLPGGQGESWRAGHVVLKPTAAVAEAAWTAEVLSGLKPAGFRINEPVHSSSGAWVVDGWTAFAFLPGEHDLANRWPEVIRVGAALNDALVEVERPAFLEERTGPWSVGDHVAWGELPLDIGHDELKVVADELADYVEPEGLASQVIHRDPSGNLLFDDGQRPAVIDFVPYWRPALFSLAIVIVDAVAWFGADPALGLLLPERERQSLLARAALYRLVTSDVAARSMSGLVHQQYLHRGAQDYSRLLPLVR